MSAPIQTTDRRPLQDLSAMHLAKELRSFKTKMMHDIELDPRGYYCLLLDEAAVRLENVHV